MSSNIQNNLNGKVISMRLTTDEGDKMYELMNQLVNEAHRQNMVRDARHERNLREAEIAREEAKRERNYDANRQDKTVRKAR
jgi:hypothetical protein